MKAAKRLKRAFYYVLTFLIGFQSAQKALAQDGFGVVQKDLANVVQLDQQSLKVLIKDVKKERHGLDTKRVKETKELLNKIYTEREYELRRLISTLLQVLSKEDVKDNKQLQEYKDELRDIKRLYELFTYLYEYELDEDEILKNIDNGAYGSLDSYFSEIIRLYNNLKAADFQDKKLKEAREQLMKWMMEEIVSDIRKAHKIISKNKNHYAYVQWIQTIVHLYDTYLRGRTTGVDDIIEECRDEMREMGFY